MNKLLSGLLVIAVLCFLPVFVLAQEEHPKEKEHPESEHPTGKVTIDDVDKAITTSIQEQAKADGKFHIADKVANKTWDLSLVRVHKDKLASLEDGRYFACVDFKADDETMVDVDFFMKNQDGKLVVTDTSVHKVDGVARYTYKEKNGKWVRVEESR